VPKPGPDSHHLQARPAVFSSRLIVPVSAGALHGYLMSSLVTLIALYFTAINVSQSQIGIIITAVIMGTLVAQVPIGKAADRFGKRPLLLICAALLALVFAVMPIYTDWKQFLVSGALCGALAGTLYPIGLAMIGEMVSRERLGAANSLFSLAFGIGSLTGPAFSGFAMKHFGYQMLFYLPAGLVALFVLEMIFLKGEGAASESGGDP
ncbi:MAG TPA: MFS transporter, partial [Blastocatellia bacterium]|nr:MFS transporter [Blastocatellia bacterium]